MVSGLCFHRTGPLPRPVPLQKMGLRGEHYCCTLYVVSYAYRDLLTLLYYHTSTRTVCPFIILPQ